ncbi:MAG TPA: inositol monophosphatase family protein [Methylomirabilota bacterium]|nr:inositol monophosphatase family protein [Methylomirabilota bacterium]
MLKSSDQKRALKASVDIARETGLLLRKNLNSSTKRINEAHQHDIKLELDVRCQKLIERGLAKAFPDVAVLGEEGEFNADDAPARWVIDPIDGTVNFTYGIPHACISIALQVRNDTRVTAKTHPDALYTTVTGMIYDPFADEMFTAIKGQPARLNNRVIQVSKRTDTRECIVSIGFAKEKRTVEAMAPVLAHMLGRVRKIRMMGAAALAMAYVASGRFDAYLESGLRLWDIAAGGLLIECAGGEYWHRPLPGAHYYEIAANNGLIRQKLLRGLNATVLGARPA